MRTRFRREEESLRALQSAPYTHGRQIGTQVPDLPKQSARLRARPHNQPKFLRKSPRALGLGRFGTRPARDGRWGCERGGTPPPPRFTSPTVPPLRLGREKGPPGGELWWAGPGMGAVLLAAASHTSHISHTSIGLPGGEETPRWRRSSGPRGAGPSPAQVPSGGAKRDRLRGLGA